MEDVQRLVGRRHLRLARLQAPLVERLEERLDLGEVVVRQVALPADGIGRGR